MEAATLPKKKNNISKGKIKKNFKNVLCRPDLKFWPEVSGDQIARLETALRKHRINIPLFKKPHWKEIESLPKEKRPKPPKLEKVNGLVFGTSECATTIQDSQCSAVIIEANVNPRMIIQPVFEMCKAKDIPVLCLPNLKKLTLDSFGVKTSCLGIQKDHLSELYSEIVALSSLHPKPDFPNKEAIDQSNVDENSTTDSSKMDVSESPYLYRSNKKTRVFVPTGQENVKNITKKFIGQDFIDLSGKGKQSSKAYMAMILKKVSNNPDRVKKK